MAWLIARFQPVGLFSLKHGEATSTGGKSLLIPTPFAIRMALLDVALRVEGTAQAEHFVELIRSLKIALRPARYAAVSGLFGKILKPERKPEQTGRAMTPTIAFREFVHLRDEFAIAFGGEAHILERITPWLPQVTYLGKRGSFVQLLGIPEWSTAPTEEPPEGFIPLEGLNLQDGLPASFPMGTLQRIDDWGETITFAKANVYDASTAGKIKVGQDRLRIDIIMPYQMVRSGRGFTLYERIGA